MSTNLDLGILKINMIKSNAYKTATINSLTIKPILPLL